MDRNSLNSWALSILFHPPSFAHSKFRFQQWFCIEIWDQLVQRRAFTANVPLPIHVLRAVQLALINKMLMMKPVETRMFFLLRAILGHTVSTSSWLLCSEPIPCAPGTVQSLQHAWARHQGRSKRKYNYAPGRNLLAAEINWSDQSRIKSGLN